MGNGNHYNRNNNTELSGRINSLETDVKSLAMSVGSLESDVKNVVRSMENMTSTIQSLANKIQTESKTNWGILGTWAAVIITLMGSIGYLGLQPMVELLERERFTNVRQYDMINHFKEAYHTERVRTARVDQRVIDLEKIVQEIRDEQKRRTSRVYKSTSF